MKLEHLTIHGFRCFNAPVKVALDDLSAFVGTNGTGKTAVLMALARMFGATNSMRTLTKDDFCRNPDGDPPQSLDLKLDAVFAFPELLSDAQASESVAVPECLRNIIADDSGDAPRCRIRLRATWTNTPSADGDIDQQLEWLGTLEGEPQEGSVHKLSATERSLIQVHYVPAARDALRELKAASGTILSRALRLIEWDDGVRANVLELSSEMAEALRGEKALAALEGTLQRTWSQLRGSGMGKPELTIADTDLETLLRRIDPCLAVSDTGNRPIGLLSEGERSLLYFALVETALEFESEHQANGGTAASAVVPALTILAVEEPENHLAPQYLSRILGVLGAIQSHRTAQVIITSHSASILRRVEPSTVRHFRGVADGSHSVSALTLPLDDVEAYKYVREAVQAYPELYFARVVVLCEGASEEVVLPRIARALDLDVDPRFVAVVPLGGRHVNHFWRLLKNLGTPFVTLLDLDAERHGGGWGRVKYVMDELIAHGEARTDVCDLPEDEFSEIPNWEFEGWDKDVEQDWLSHLESRFGVFFSGPLDLDLMLLDAFPDEYHALAPLNGGPRIPADVAKRAERLKKAVLVVLGDEGGDGKTYGDRLLGAFPWYSYLFLAGSKPTAHALALSQIDDATLRDRAPDVLRRLIDHVKTLVGEE